MDQLNINAVIRNYVNGEYLDDGWLRNIIRENIATTLPGHPHFTLEEFGTLLGSNSWRPAVCYYCGDWMWKGIEAIINGGTYIACQTCSPLRWCDRCATVYINPFRADHQHPVVAPGCIDPHSRNNVPGTHSPDGLILSYNAKVNTEQFFDINRRNAFSDNIKIPIYGIELEVERKPNFPANLHRAIMDTFPNDYIILKRDGSLSHEGAKGFEIVSAPCTFDYIKESGHWDRFFLEFQDSLEANPDSTGLHIHIGTNALTNYEISKFWWFINRQENNKFLSWLADRKLRAHQGYDQSGNYAILKSNERLTKILHKQHERTCPLYYRQIGHKSTNRPSSWCVYGDVDPWGNPYIRNIIKPSMGKPTCKCSRMRYATNRHEAFNLNTNLPTVELRIFKGNMSAAHFFSCVEFTDSMVTFIKHFTKDDMLWSLYCEWVIKDRQRIYPHLVARIKKAYSSNLVGTFWAPPMQTTKKPSKVVPAVALQEFAINVGGTMTIVSPHFTFSDMTNGSTVETTITEFEEPEELDF